jgi:hypothetical protein
LTKLAELGMRGFFAALFRVLIFVALVFLLLWLGYDSLAGIISRRI